MGPLETRPLHPFPGPEGVDRGQLRPAAVAQVLAYSEVDAEVMRGSGGWPTPRVR
jgi:hypothetical protein